MSRSVLAMMLSDIRVTAAFKSNGKNVINASWNATSAVADENSVEGARVSAIMTTGIRGEVTENARERIKSLARGPV